MIHSDNNTIVYSEKEIEDVKFLTRALVDIGTNYLNSATNPGLVYEAIGGITGFLFAVVGSTTNLSSKLKDLPIRVDHKLVAAATTLVASGLGELLPAFALTMTSVFSTIVGGNYKSEFLESLQKPSKEADPRLVKIIELYKKNPTKFLLTIASDPALVARINEFQTAITNVLSGDLLKTLVKSVQIHKLVSSSFSKPFFQPNNPLSKAIYNLQFPIIEKNEDNFIVSTIIDELAKHDGVRFGGVSDFVHKEKIKNIYKIVWAEAKAEAGEASSIDKVIKILVKNINKRTNVLTSNDALIEAVTKNVLKSLDKEFTFTDEQIVKAFTSELVPFAKNIFAYPVEVLDEKTTLRANAKAQTTHLSAEEKTKLATANINRKQKQDNTEKLDKAGLEWRKFKDANNISPQLTKDFIDKILLKNAKMYELGDYLASKKLHEKTEDERLKIAEETAKDDRYRTIPQDDIQLLIRAIVDANNISPQLTKFNEVISLVDLFTQTTAIPTIPADFLIKHQEPLLNLIFLRPEIKLALESLGLSREVIKGSLFQILTNLGEKIKDPAVYKKAKDLLNNNASAFEKLVTLEKIKDIENQRKTLLTKVAIEVSAKPDLSRLGRDEFYALIYNAAENSSSTIKLGEKDITDFIDKILLKNAKMYELGDCLASKKLHKKTEDERLKIAEEAAKDGKYRTIPQDDIQLLIKAIVEANIAELTGDELSRRVRQIVENTSKFSTEELTSFGDKIATDNLPKLTKEELSNLADDALDLAIAVDIPSMIQKGNVKIAELLQIGLRFLPDSVQAATYAPIHLIAPMLEMLVSNNHLESLKNHTDDIAEVYEQIILKKLTHQQISKTLLGLFTSIASSFDFAKMTEILRNHGSQALQRAYNGKFNADFNFETTFKDLVAVASTVVPIPAEMRKFEEAAVNTVSPAISLVKLPVVILKNVVTSKKGVERMTEHAVNSFTFMSNKDNPDIHKNDKNAFYLIERGTACVDKFRTNIMHQKGFIGTNIFVMKCGYELAVLLYKLIKSSQVQAALSPIQELTTAVEKKDTQESIAELSQNLKAKEKYLISTVNALKEKVPPQYKKAAGVLNGVDLLLYRFISKEESINSLFVTIGAVSRLSPWYFVKNNSVCHYVNMAKFGMDLSLTITLNASQVASEYIADKIKAKYKDYFGSNNGIAAPAA